MQRHSVPSIVRATSVPLHRQCIVCCLILAVSDRCLMPDSDLTSHVIIVVQMFDVNPYRFSRSTSGRRIRSNSIWRLRDYQAFGMHAMERAATVSMYIGNILSPHHIATLSIAHAYPAFGHTGSIGRHISPHSQVNLTVTTQP